MRCDPGLSLDTFYINTCNFLLLPIFTPFGSTVRGKGNPKIASIGHSVLVNPKVRYDTGFSIAILLPLLLPLLGLRSGVKASLRHLH